MEEHYCEPCQRIHGRYMTDIDEISVHLLRTKPTDLEQIVNLLQMLWTNYGIMKSQYMIQTKYIFEIKQKLENISKKLKVTEEEEERFYTP